MSACQVIGSGYAGPHGWSIMPGYRDQLMIGNLIDLVAALEGARAPRLWDDGEAELRRFLGDARVT